MTNAFMIYTQVQGQPNAKRYVEFDAANEADKTEARATAETLAATFRTQRGVQHVGIKEVTR